METMATGTSEQTPSMEQQHDHVLETPTMDYAEVLSCSKVFGLESEKISPKEKQMLEECYKWAKSETRENVDVFQVLINRRNILGTPISGESYLVRMYQWVKQHMIVEEEKRKLMEMEINA